MARGDEANGRFGQGFNDLQVFLTGDAENDLNTLLDKTFHQFFCGIHEVRSYL